MIPIYGDHIDRRDFADALERAWERRHEWKDMGILAHGRIARLGDFDSSKDLIKLLDEVDCSTSA
jgi:hypothetical protein